MRSNEYGTYFFPFKLHVKALLSSFQKYLPTIECSVMLRTDGSSMVLLLCLLLSRLLHQCIQIYLQQLSSVGWELGMIASQLTITPNISYGVREIVSTSSVCIKRLSLTLSTEGHRVLILVDLLKHALSLDEIDLEHTGEAIQNLGDKIKTTRIEVMNLQTAVRDNTVNSRSEAYTHTTEVTSKLEKVSQLNGKIKQLDNDIAQCERNSQTFDNAANDLDNRARELDRQEKKHNKLGILSAVAGLVGVVFVPFTGR